MQDTNMLPYYHQLTEREKSLIRSTLNVYAPRVDAAALPFLSHKKCTHWLCEFYWIGNKCPESSVDVELRKMLAKLGKPLRKTKPQL